MQTLANGAAEDQTQPTVVAAVSSMNMEKFAITRMSLQGQDNSVSAAPHSDISGDAKNVLAGQTVKTKASTTKKHASKKVDTKTQSSGLSWISWLWTDVQGAPSVRHPKSGSGDWPKFK